jgi:hypothetical protein
MPRNNRGENSRAAADEVTPLLANSSGGPTAAPRGSEDVVTQQQTNTGEDEDKPMPKLQIFLLCFARLVDPVSFFCIFPFVNEMIYETGNVDETDVGFYSGLIVCLIHSSPTTYLLTLMSRSHFSR